MSAPTCPSWCTRHDVDDEGELSAHQRPIGDLGVMLECPPAGETLVYVPELDRERDDSATPAFAARLASDMLTAATIAQDGHFTTP